MERLSGVHFLHGSGSHAGLLPGLGAEIRLRNVLKSVYETSGTRFETVRLKTDDCQWQPMTTNDDRWHPALQAYPAKYN